MTVAPELDHDRSSTTASTARLLYRAGFLATTEPLRGSQEWKAIRSGWKARRVGPLTVSLHPETLFHSVTQGGATIAVLGEVYAIRGTLDAVLNSMVAAVVAANFEALHALLDDLSGRFALLATNDGTWRVYHDPFGSRTLFYRGGVVASHADLLAHAVGAKRSSAVVRFMDSEAFRGRTVRYLPGDLTVYEGVYALAPNNGYDGSKTFRYWPRGPVASADFAQFLAEMTRSTMALIEHLRSRGPVIGVTGGIDSRVLVAAFRAGRLPFVGVTWQGGYTRVEEQPIIERVAQLAGAHLNITVDRTTPVNDVAIASGRNGGNYRGRSLLAQAMADVPGGVFVRGYGGEIIRGFYNLNLKNPDLAIEPKALLRMYGGSAPPPTGGYAEVGERAFADFIDRANYSGVDGLGYEVADLFYWEQRMGMWGAGMLNEMDAAMLSLVGINSRPLYQTAFGLPREERLTKNLLARVVEATYPPLAGMPYA